jgi:histidine ammonia-lyase
MCLLHFLKIYFSALSELPAFLVKEGGLNSGFMLAHCTAAALGKSIV